MTTRNEEQKAIRTYRAAMRNLATTQKAARAANAAAEALKRKEWDAQNTAESAEADMLRVLAS